jgi:hypothetical protein
MVPLGFEAFRNSYAVFNEKKNPEIGLTAVTILELEARAA